MTDKLAEAVERVERLLAAFQLLPDSATVYNLNLGDLRTLLSLTKPDEEMVARAIEAEMDRQCEDTMSYVGSTDADGFTLIDGDFEILKLARAAIKAITLDLYDGES